MDLIIRISIYLYIIHVIWTIIKASNRRTLYLWSPVIFLDVYFIENVLLSYLLVDDLSGEIYAFKYITLTGLFVGIVFHFLLYKYNFIEPEFYIPQQYVVTNEKRRKILNICLLIVLLTGLATGVTTTFLSGGNIEGMRRTEEVGIGFIRDIPIMILQISLLVYLFVDESPIKKKTIYVVLIAFVLFLSTGNKAIILSISTPYIIYLLLTYRGFKLWHYLSYKFLIPLVAGILNGIRSADLSSIYTHTMNYLYSSVWLFEVNTYQIITQTEQQHAFLNGDEFIASTTRIIPRFLWPDKPMSYDYYYKELINYEFEGGGTPMPYIYRFYTNFGYSFPIFYILYFLIILYIYKYMHHCPRPLPILMIALLMLSGSNGTPLNITYYLQLLFLISIVYKTFVSKKTII